MCGTRIAVLGGGHGARTVAADMAIMGHHVTLCEFEQFHASVAEIFARNTIFISGKARNGEAKLARCTHDLGEAVTDVELILIVVPSLYHRVYAKALAPVLRNGHHVVLIPGTLGSLEFMTIIREEGCHAEITVSELDTLPYATRITGPASVNVYHALPVFSLGVFPADRTTEVLSLFRNLYPGVGSFRDVLEAGLANCNPVIHPLGVLLNAGRIEYSRGEFWYYEEGITLSTARAMELLDHERMEIGARLGLSLPDQAAALHAVGYGPQGDLWQVLKASKGLTPIKGPTSLTNRYLTEDIPIGLVCWSELGEQLGVATPLMRATIAIGIAISGVDYWKTGRTMERCGIKGMSVEQIVRFAKTGEK